jgi:hypothetical protein
VLVVIKVRGRVGGVRLSNNPLRASTHIVIITKQLTAAAQGEWVSERENLSYIYMRACRLSYINTESTQWINNHKPNVRPTCKAIIMKMNFCPLDHVLSVWESEWVEWAAAEGMKIKYCCGALLTWDLTCNILLPLAHLDSPCGGAALLGKRALCNLLFWRHASKSLVIRWAESARTGD